MYSIFSLLLKLCILCLLHSAIALGVSLPCLGIFIILMAIGCCVIEKQTKGVWLLPVTLYMHFMSCPVTHTTHSMYIHMNYTALCKHVLYAQIDVYMSLL